MAEIISRIGTGQHYTTIAAWEAACDANGDSLDTTGGTVTVDFTSDNIYVGELTEDVTVSQSGTNGQGAVYIGGAPTTTTSYRILRSQPGSPRRTIQATSWAGIANIERMYLVHIAEGHSRVTDVEGRITGFPASGNFANTTILFVTSGAWGFMRCVARDTNVTGGGTANRGVYGFSGINGTARILRCAAWGLVPSGTQPGRGIQHALITPGTSHILGNTIYGMGQRGISVETNHASATLELHNNLAVGSPTDISTFVWQGSGPINRSGNMTSDTTGDSGLTGVTASDVFESLSPFDYHLKTGSPAIDAGVDLSSMLGGLADLDIDGDAVSGSWDIGADEAVATSISVDLPVASADAEAQSLSVLASGLVVNLPAASTTVAPSSSPTALRVRRTVPLDTVSVAATALAPGSVLGGAIIINLPVAATQASAGGGLGQQQVMPVVSVTTEAQAMTAGNGLITAIPVVSAAVQAQAMTSLTDTVVTLPVASVSASAQGFSAVRPSLAGTGRGLLLRYRRRR